MYCTKYDSSEDFDLLISCDFSTNFARTHGANENAAVLQCCYCCEVVGKPKQFRFDFGRKFWSKYDLVSVFRLFAFWMIRPKHFFRLKPCFGPVFGQKSGVKPYILFWLKQNISAERVCFDRNRMFWPKKVFRLFPGALFQFRFFGQKSLSFPHYCEGFLIISLSLLAEPQTKEAAKHR